MKQKILDLIAEKPKHYVKLIAKDPALLEWVNTNSLSSSDRIVARIYSAIHQVSDVCENGNTKKFDRISTGFIGCGPANVCQCTAKNISKNVSSTKSNVSDDERKLTNSKRESTMLEKYGVSYNSQREDKKHIWTAPKIPLTVHSKLVDYEWMNEEYNIKKRSLSEIADELGIYYSTVTEYCKKFGFIIRPTSLRSKEEVQICEYIRSLGFHVEESNRSIISPKELDIFIPEAKLAIEVNGLRWHSHNPSEGIVEDRNKHLYKTKQALAANITLLHFTDHEWHEKTDIVKSIIKTRLGINNKIPARNCNILPIDNITEKDFLNKHHIQGYTASKFAYGLFYKSELVMLITMGKSRFNKNYDYEILRMCTKSDISVIGGVSKFVSYIKQIFPSCTIVSYCDLSKGTGKGYLNAGFIFKEDTKPGYFWTDGVNVISRYKCQKSNLKKWLKSYDSTLSESLNMFNAKYRRYWDCGNGIYVLYS